MKILLLHPGGLGDIILALPAIGLLREKFPAAGITIAANLDHVAPITGDWVESAIALSSLPLHNLYSDEELPAFDVRFWRSFDRIVSWTGSGDACFASKLPAIHPEVRIASWRPRPDEPRHVSQIFIDSLGPEIASGISAAHVRIHIDAAMREAASHWFSEQNWTGNRPFIILHPGAGSISKRWPSERFAELARRLVLRGKRVLIVDGPAESGLAGRIAEASPGNAVLAASSLSLNILAAVMSSAESFVGNDSGIAHLAAALGIPSAVIFGPTLPQHWAPLGRHATVLRDVRNCEGCSGEGKHTCLENITVKNVIQRVPAL
jgi:heptosyltransferase III